MAKVNGGGRGPMSVNLDKAKDSKATMKRILSYLEGHKKTLILVVLFIILYVACNLISSIMLMPIIDDYIVPMFEHPEEASLKIAFIKILVIYIVVVLLTTVFSYLQSKLMIKASQTAVADMRRDLFAKIETLPIRYFDTHATGELMSRIVNDLDNVSIALNTSVNQIISGALMVISTLITMIVISPILALISILTLPIMLLVVRKIASINKRQFVKSQESLAEVNSYIEEYVSGQKVIKAFNKEEDVKNNFKEKNEHLRKEGFLAQAVAGIVMPAMGSISNISTAITAIVSGILAVNGKISIGTIALYTRFSKEFSRPINEITNQFNVIQAGVAGAERCFQIIDEEIEFPDNIGKPEMKEVKGHVEIKNVDFGYEEGKPILKDINIEAKPGEMIAIVGPTGAGKTTIINLLTRFYDVGKGEILIDGTNIKEISKESLREALGIVLQDTVMFNETVKENIRFGKLEATEEEIIEAAKLANAHSFIKRLPHGYDTILSDDAGNISKGQAQLLNIARVILNDPQILILDEATSNVDTRMEVKIQEAMNQLLKRRTSFVIAHRLSTIRNADKIIVINEGQIKEQGTHEELIEKRGIYYTMYTGIFEEAG